jgi:hypothetical protein
MTRPSINEHDTGSYLDATVSAHQVLEVTELGIRAEGSPSHDFDELLAPRYLCKEHATASAQTSGFTEPVPVLVAYQAHLLCELEHVQLKFDESGKLTHIAAYSYGRAYFAPGEPRTAPCDVCGVETLIDGFV